MNGPFPNMTPNEKDDSLTAEEHLRAAFAELRNAREALHRQYGPINMLKRHPGVAAGAGLAGLFLVKRLFGRKRKRSGPEDENDGSVARTFTRSLLMGLARHAGKMLPGLVLYWLAHRHGFHPFKFGRRGSHGFDDMREDR
jgi:hypothetical protein